jgi:hypothetical protein
MMSFTLFCLVPGESRPEFQPVPVRRGEDNASPAGKQDFLASRSPTWARINAEPESSFARNAA